MIGAFAVAFVILFVLPPMLLMRLGAVSAIFGWAAQDNAEQLHAGSELIELHR